MKNRWAKSGAKRVGSAILLVLLSLFTGLAQAQQSQPRIAYEPFADNAGHWYGIADKNNVINARHDRPRYKETDVASIGDNILLFQKNNGGWPKNYDMFAILTPDQKDSVAKSRFDTKTTFDNDNTYTQIAALAVVYSATGIEKYKKGAVKGLEYILDAQYKNGGWPQYYPLESGYSREITFNDDVFEGIMRLLKDVLDGKAQYAFVDEKLKGKLKIAYDKGMDCIIKTQINDAGKPTAWCQQYDERSLKPAWARKFEPPSICNGESSNLVLFLMSIDNPQKEIVDAIQNATAWFQESKIYNTRVNTIQAPRMVTPYRISVSDKVVVTDPAAPPIWTRYYELKTHKPLFCNRDSKVVYSLAELDRERRDGYGWYTYAPQKVLDHYHDWQQKYAPGNDVLITK